MEILKTLKPNSEACALALGYFDGVHPGHQEIMRELTDAAKKKNLKTAVLTFSKNPASYFAQERAEGPDGSLRADGGAGANVCADAEGGADSAGSAGVNSGSAGSGAGADVCMGARASTGGAGTDADSAGGSTGTMAGADTGTSDGGFCAGVREGAGGSIGEGAGAPVRMCADAGGSADCFFEKTTLKPVFDIQTNEQKEKILEEFKIDYLYELDFEEFKNLDRDEYINLLIKNLNPKLIVAGFNHTFGKGRLGGSGYLKNMLPDIARIVPEFKKDGICISSSLIREEIQKGNVENVEKYLSRPFSIKNKVDRGDMVARKLGYPTANTAYSQGIVKLPYGVYFGYCEHKGIKYPAMISWGIKPTLKNEPAETLEAYLEGFEGNLYGEEIEIYFRHKLREQIKFRGIEELKKQLDCDYRDFKRYIS